MTFFTQTNDNQYQYIKQLYLEGHEVSIHSITHSTGATTTKAEWEREILKAREYIAKYCIDFLEIWSIAGIPESEIVGFRAPDLKYNDWMLEVLQERGFLYDSSIPTDTLYYPYTLDQGAIEQSWRGRTITSPHPGLWEVRIDWDFNSRSLFLQSLIRMVRSSQFRILQDQQKRFLNWWNTISVCILEW